MRNSSYQEMLRAPLALATAIALAAGGAVVGCEVYQDSLGPSLERCYDAPQPAIAEADIPAPTKIAVEEGGKIAGTDTQPDATVKSLLEQAAVIVKIGDSVDSYGNESIEAHGSGYVTTGRDGRQRIITAAHIPASHGTNEVSIETNDHQKATVTGGCYLFESDGHFDPFTTDDGKEPIAETDVAVLTLDHPLVNITPLEQASEPPAPGTWGYAVNFQKYARPGDPVDFPVLHIANYGGRQLNGITALQLLGPHVTRDLLDQVRSEGGSSGGLEADPTSGKVWAITTSGTLENLYYDIDGLETNSKIRVKFKGQGVAELTDTNGFYPHIAGMVGAAIIDRALDSPKA